MIHVSRKIMMCLDCCRWKQKYSVKDTKENKNETSTTKINEDQPCFKRRYYISFIGFLTYLIMNAHRMSISVAIVEIVIPPTHRNLPVPHVLNATQEINHHISQSEVQTTVKYDWSPQMQGIILGAGFFGYVLTLAVGGKLAETFGPKITLFSGTFVSSFTTLITPLTPAVHVYFLIVIQCVRGIAQGFMLPATSVLSANWYPKAERGFLVGIGLTGYQLGRLVGGVLSGLICDSTSMGGWPSVFYIFGGFGIFLSLIQLFTVYSMPKDDPKISKAELNHIQAGQESVLTRKRPPAPWKKIFTSLQTYALIFGMCGQYWAGIYFTSSHATFAADILKYPVSQNGLIVSTPYIIPLVVVPGVSYLSSWLNKNKYLTVNKVRKLWNLFGSLGFSICLMVIILTKCEKVVATVCSFIAVATSSISIVTTMTVPVDMSPTFAGSLTGLSIGIASFVGFFVPVVCGALTNKEQTVEQWTIFFIICIAIVLSSSIFFVLFGSAEVQSYNYSNKDLPESLKKENNLPLEKKDGLEKES
ncbi:sialin-like isoform X2 [Uloborus diversus]|uniref:sialin-like isoform X2 n=1 Tax=Uloborus diversus TaxID=327109 RepID=UPI002409E051|nr:sialin-like isoform X2 [Uloborus diversus]